MSTGIDGKPHAGIRTCCLTMGSRIDGNAEAWRRMLFGLIAGMAPLLYGEVIYENDFSTRTSTGAISTSNWYEMPYHVGALAYNYGKRWVTDETPYLDHTQIQDGWALANINRDNGDYVMAPAYVATNSLEQVPEGDDANQFFKIHGVLHPRSAMATHPLGNDFTNGVVRFSADIRAPAVWYASSAGFARVVPLYRSQMNALNWGGSYQAPTAFGLQNRGEKTVPFLLYGAGDEATASGLDLPNSDNSHAVGRRWHRFVTEIDLDAKRVSCTVYQLGLDNPTPETQGTLVASVSDKQFYRPLTVERGAISGIGLLTYWTFAESTAVTNSACFDNLLVAWKAPGASEFQVCYENDFTTRRRRTICPAGTTSAAYPAATGPATDEYGGFYDGMKIVPDSDKNLKNMEPQPLGVDNWRRVNDDGTAYAHVVELQGQRVLRTTMVAAEGGGFVCLTQPLGEEIASGKVRLSADIRLPDRWHWTEARSAGVTMGTTAFASTLWGDFSSKGRVGTVGIRGASDAEFHPFHVGSTTVTDTSVNCASQEWYRVIQTADVTTRKYDCEIYHLANGSLDGEPVHVASGVPFSKDDVTSIGSFALLAYAPGTGTSQGILFDNVKVWKNVGEENETQIYYNDFTVRRRVVETGRLQVAQLIERPGSGVDNWMRFSSGAASAFVQTAANPALAIVGADSFAYVAHPFGTDVVNGDTLKFSIDVHPPRQWTWESHAVDIMLGDDVFMQGNCNDVDAFSNHASISFGFDTTNRLANSCGIWKDSVSYVHSGSAVITGATATASHWYRFRVEAPRGKPTYSVRIYDMGTDHPEMATPDGTLVGSYENLLYKNGGATKRISGFIVSAFGVPGFNPWDSEDPDAAYYDNIRAEVMPPGITIFVR